MIEFRDPELESYFQKLGLPVEDVEIYLVEEAPVNRKSVDANGSYFPRKGKGFIELQDNFDETYRIYIHELSHGALFENTELGQRISELESRTHTIERNLFGQVNSEDFHVLPSKDVETGIKINDDPKIYKAPYDALFRYKSNRDELEKAFDENESIIEGFAIFIEKEILGSVEETLPRDHEEGYEFFKRLKQNEGLETVQNFLSQT